MKTYVDCDGNEYPVSNIFDFNEDDFKYCGKHECGYTTDGAIFIKSDIIPADWSIKDAPLQLSLSNFAGNISKLKDLEPLDIEPLQDDTFPWCLRFPGTDVVLSNMYVNLVNYLGCSIKYQKRARESNWMSYALAIEHSGEIVGVLMPIRN